jgi:hypothetical protein
VEFSRRAPEIHFHRVSDTRGIDLLEELRGANGQAADGKLSEER